MFPRCGRNILGYLLTPWLLVQVPSSSKLDSPSAPRLHLTTLSVVHSSAVLTISKIHTQPYRPRSWQQVQMSHRSPWFEKHQTSQHCSAGWTRCNLYLPESLFRSFTEKQQGRWGKRDHTLGTALQGRVRVLLWTLVVILTGCHNNRVRPLPPRNSRPSVESTNTENIWINFALVLSRHRSFPARAPWVACLKLSHSPALFAWEVVTWPWMGMWNRCINQTSTESRKEIHFKTVLWYTHTRAHTCAYTHTHFIIC